MGLFDILHVVETLNDILITKRNSCFRKLVCPELAFGLFAKVVAVHQEQDFFSRGIIEQTIRRCACGKCFTSTRCKDNQSLFLAMLKAQFQVANCIVLALAQTSFGLRLHCGDRRHFCKFRTKFCTNCDFFRREHLFKFKELQRLSSSEIPSVAEQQLVAITHEKEWQRFCPCLVPRKRPCGILCSLFSNVHPQRVLCTFSLKNTNSLSI